jgi:hypothetical protein
VNDHHPEIIRREPVGAADPVSGPETGVAVARVRGVRCEPAFAPVSVEDNRQVPERQRIAAVVREHDVRGRDFQHQVGAVIIAQTGGDDGPTTDLVLEVTASDVALTHNGGDTLALGDLTVVLDADGSERRFTPDAANTSDGDARLRPGDRISRAHGFPSDDLGVMVVHDPSNSVLVDDRERIPA